MELRGKTTLITGAGTGIGRALAIEASRRGMTLALVGRRVDRLRDTRAALETSRGCLILPGDVTDAKARRVIRDSVGEEWGRLHVLVNNAGIVSAGPLAETTDDELQHLMAINVIAPVALTRDFLPLLRVASPSRIVNLGSMLGEIPLPMFAPYSASKSALRGLSAALRRELEGLGIGVTHATPRGARTDSIRAIGRFIDPFEMRLDHAHEIARDIWDAVARGRSVAYPRGRERLYMFVERLFPSLVDRAMASQVAKGGIDRLIEGSVKPPVPAIDRFRPALPPR